MAAVTQSKQINLLKRRIANQDDWRDQRRALLTLTEMAAEKAWPLVATGLADPVDEVRHAAVMVAGRLEIHEAREELLKPRILGSPSADLRWAAVHALGRLRDTRDIILLTRMLADDDWLVRNEARKVLSTAVNELGEGTDEADVDTLVHLLFLDNPTLRPLVLRSLCRQGSQALPALREALNEPSPAMLAGVIRVLGLLFDQHSLVRITSMAFHADRQVRQAVAEALGHLGGEEAGRCLVRMLSIRQKDVRDTVVHSLELLGFQALDSLLEALQHDSCVRVRVECIRLLGRIKASQALPLLKESLRSSYFQVRQATVEALIEYGPQLVPELLPLLRVHAPNVEALIVQYDGEKTLEGRSRLISVIGETGNHEAVPFLKEIRQGAGDPDGLPLRRAINRALFQLGCFAWERYCVLSILGQIGTEDVVPDLLPSLQHPSYYVRNRAVRSLAPFRLPQVEKQLAILAIQDPRYFVRRNALQTLGGMTSDPALRQRTALRAMKDSTMGVRIEAVRVLGRLMQPKALPALCRGLADPVWSVREACEVAVRNFGPAAAIPVSKLLNHDKEPIRYRVARLLGKLANPDPLPALKRRLPKEETNGRVSNALMESIRRLQS